MRQRRGRSRLWTWLGFGAVSLIVAAGPAGASAQQPAGIEANVENGAIAFARSPAESPLRMIYRMSRDGDNLLQLTDADTLDFSPAWSNDGEQLAFSRLNEMGMVNIFTIGPRGGTLTQVTTSGANDDEANVAATWRPNNRWIAFTRGPFVGEGAPGIFRQRLDGKGLKQLTASPDGDTNPAWSPRGGRILFTRSTASEEAAIWSVKHDGTGERRLTDDRKGTDNAHWSPDGRWIVFNRARGNGSAIFKMRANGGSLERLTKGGQVDANPVFSPNGKRIAFDRAPNQNSSSASIFKMRANGSRKQRLTVGAANDIEPSWRGRLSR